MPHQKKSTQQTGSIIEQVDLGAGTLATKTGVIVNGPAVTRGGKFLSTSIRGALRGLTAEEGPILYGIMNADFSLAELEEYLELAGPLTPNDKVSSERASRGQFIRVLGVAGPSLDQTTIRHVNHKMSGLKFAETGESTGGWEWWIYNLGAATLTTGSVLSLFCQHFVAWNPSG